METTLRIFLGGYNANTSESPGSETTVKERVTIHGDSLVDVSNHPDIFLCFDFLLSDYILSRRNGITRSQSILIRNEPIVVRPQNFHPFTKVGFGLVIDMGRDPKLNVYAENWPQFWPQTYPLTGQHENRSNRVVIVNGNKVSVIKGELYSLRRKCIKCLDFIDVYGTDWDMRLGKQVRYVLSHLRIALENSQLPRISGLRYWFRKPKNWLGSPQEKLNILSNYKFSLVIENSTEFMTEKIFDSFFGGCIPIYVGPDLDHFGIPRDLYIQAEPNLESIIEGLERAKKINYMDWKTRTQDWLASSATHELWEADKVFQRIFSKIGLTVRGQ